MGAGATGARTMHKMSLIFRHELTNAVRSAWFVMLTLALPVVAFLGIRI